MELIKHRVAHYWSHRAEAFEAQRLREFDSEKRARWLAEFFRYLPQGRPLRVLDIGTGTGFFACLFAAEGHEATGIDLTPDIIEHAEPFWGWTPRSGSWTQKTRTSSRRASTCW